MKILPAMPGLVRLASSFDRVATPIPWIHKAFISRVSPVLAETLDKIPIPSAMPIISSKPMTEIARLMVSTGLF